MVDAEAFSTYPFDAAIRVLFAGPAQVGVKRQAHGDRVGAGHLFATPAQGALFHAGDGANGPVRVVDAPVAEAVGIFLAGAAEVSFLLAPDPGVNRHVSPQVQRLHSIAGRHTVIMLDDDFAGPRVAIGGRGVRGIGHPRARTARQYHDCRGRPVGQKPVVHDLYLIHSQQTERTRFSQQHQLLERGRARARRSVFFDPANRFCYDGRHKFR